MSAIRTVTCDGCKAVKPEHPDVAWWDFQYSSMDTRARDGINWRFRSGSWDFCPDCAIKAREGLIAIGGKPDHDSFEDEPETTA